MVREKGIGYGYGRQQPIIPPSLNDLNLPANRSNLLATIAVFHLDEEYSPQSPEQCHPSPNCAPLMNLSTIIEGWETPHTTTDDNTFYSEDEPRRVYWDTPSTSTFDSNEPRQISFISSPSSTPPSPRRQKRKLSMGTFFLKKWECRSTHATHAASPYKREKHPDSQTHSNTNTINRSSY